MIKFGDTTILLEYNKGPYGAWLYEKAFKTSLTNDIWEMSGQGSDEIVLDSIALYKLVYIMGGFYGRKTWEDFLKSVPADYNIIDDIALIIEKAQDFYLPTKAPKKEEKEITKETE